MIRKSLFGFILTILVTLVATPTWSAHSPSATLNFGTIGAGTYQLDGNFDATGTGITYGFELIDLTGTISHAGDAGPGWGTQYYVRIWLTNDATETSIDSLTAFSDFGIFMNPTGTPRKSWDSRTDGSLLTQTLWPDYYEVYLTGPVNSTFTLNIEVQPAVVPEPATWLLMLGGLGGLLLTRLRRKTV